MTKKRKALEHVTAYRSRMKTRGLRQVSLWLPDTRSPEFKKECRWQSLVIAAAERGQSIDALLNRAAKAVEGWT
jgi:Protein  of unknown function (DUF3018)